VELNISLFELLDAWLARTPLLEFWDSYYSTAAAVFFRNGINLSNGCVDGETYYEKPGS